MAVRATGAHCGKRRPVAPLAPSGRPRAGRDRPGGATRCPRCSSFATRTSRADSAHLDLRIHDAPEFLHRFGHAEVVQWLALEVADQPAPYADVVVVALEVHVEAESVAARSERGDETEITKHPQRPVDRVERDGRHTTSHGAKNGLRIRVFLRRRELSKDLEALMGQLDAGVLHDGRNVLEPLLDVRLDVPGL